MRTKKDTLFIRIYNGLIKENPTMILCLGFCPTLAVSTTAKKALVMGIFTTAVLILSNLILSLTRKRIPQKERFLAFILVIGSLTTVAQLFLKAYFPDISEALGIYVPLTAVNSLLYDRAEKYAMHNNAVLSFFDGVGMGLGFTLIITVLGALREMIGIGTIFGYRIIPDGFTVPAAALAPGAFILLACLIAIGNKIRGGRRS